MATGPGLFVNRAIGMGVDTAVDADDIDFVVDFYDERRMPAEIELCPYADDRLRGPRLERGFAVAWFRTWFTCTVDMADLVVPGAGVATEFERVDSRTRRSCNGPPCTVRSRVDVPTDTLESRLRRATRCRARTTSSRRRPASPWACAR